VFVLLPNKGIKVGGGKKNSYLRSRANPDAKGDPGGGEEEEGRHVPGGKAGEEGGKGGPP